MMGMQLKNGICQNGFMCSRNFVRWSYKERGFRMKNSYVPRQDVQNLSTTCERDKYYLLKYLIIEKEIWSDVSKKKKEELFL